MFALQKERSFWVPIGVQYIYSIYIYNIFCTHVTWEQLTWSDSHDPSSEIWPWQLFLSLPQEKTWPKIENFPDFFLEPPVEVPARSQSLCRIVPVPSLVSVAAWLQPGSQWNQLVHWRSLHPRMKRKNKIKPPKGNLEKPMKNTSLPRLWRLKMFIFNIFQGVSQPSALCFGFLPRCFECMEYLPIA